MNVRRISLLAAVLIALVVVSVACGGGGGGAPSASGTKTFNVDATEFSFAPNTFSATVGDQISFKVTNKGTVDHNFVILNADGSQELAKMEVKVGTTNTLNFTPTAAGEYQIDCNLPGHKEAGMTAKLTVK
jgi:plastocyanin